MKKIIKDIVVIVFLLLLGVFVYKYSFHAPFQLDDYIRIVDNSLIKFIKNVDYIWRYDPSRFIPNLSFALNYHFFKLETFSYHVVNFSIHLITSFLVFIFARLVFGLFNVEKSEKIALLSAMIFLVHPIQTSAVTYIVQRSTLMAGMFYISALLFYVKHRISDKRVFYALSLISVVLGSFCKPIIVTLPLAILLSEVCLITKSFKIKKKTILSILPYFVLSLIVPILLNLWRYKAISFEKMMRLTMETRSIGRMEYLFTQFNVLVTYLKLLFFPVNQCLDYDYPIAQGFFEFPTMLSFALLLSMFLLGVVLYRRNKILSFAIFWFFITLSSESTIIPIADVIFEHRLYIPMIGFSLFLPCFLGQVIRNKRNFAIAVVLIVLSFSMLSLQRNYVWSDRVLFLTDLAKKSPNKVRVIGNHQDPKHSIFFYVSFLTKD